MTYYWRLRGLVAFDKLGLCLKNFNTWYILLQPYHK